MGDISSVLFVLGSSIFDFLFLCDFFLSLGWIQRYWKQALVLSSLTLGAFFLTLFDGGLDTNDPVVAIAILQVLLGSIRTVGVLMLGMYYCAAAGVPSFPWLLQLIKPGPRRTHVTPAVEGIEAEVATSPEDVFPENSRQELLSFWSWMSIGIVIPIVYTVILFFIVKPAQVGDMAVGVSGKEMLDQYRERFLPLVGYLLLGVFDEEFIFRLGIQNFLLGRLHWDKRGAWVAIVLTALLWTLGHSGILTPNWVKLVQVFPIGILWGWLAHRYGVGTSVMVHAVFNLVVAIGGLYLS